MKKKLGKLTFQGWDGSWKPSRKAKKVLEEQLERLYKAFSPRGVDVQADMFAGRGQLPIAFLHLYINGHDDGCGFRIFADELPEGSKRTLGACVNYIIDNLPDHVTMVIEKWGRRWPVLYADEEWVAEIVAKELRVMR